MGMFDEIVVECDLPGDMPVEPSGVWQTKDTPDQSLCRLTLGADRVLRYRGGEVVPYTGRLAFYDYPGPWPNWCLYFRAEVENGVVSGLEARHRPPDRSWENIGAVARPEY